MVAGRQAENRLRERKYLTVSDSCAHQKTLVDVRGQNEQTGWRPWHSYSNHRFYSVLTIQTHFCLYVYVCVHKQKVKTSDGTDIMAEKHREGNNSCWDGLMTVAQVGVNKPRA